MNRTICAVAFGVGLIAVLWVGAGYVGSSALALTMTALIGGVYVTGAVELLRFHRTTSALARALDVIPDGLENAGEWLRGLPASLQNPVRLRIEGERVGLPGPAMTPYLVGLLVLLGMLGTFLGMVVTLNGAVIALESTTNLEAIRASLAAPVRGLGVAFGTSVAGVAASAMLGLISAVCRRERLQVGQRLDTRIATTLRGFSLVHQRQETYKALQVQAQLLPELVERFDAMMARMDRQGRELNEQLLSGQERFHRDAREMYSNLARSVDESLRVSLTESARLAGETIQPVVAATMDGIARETAALQERVAHAVGTQLDGISERFGASVATVADTWTTALAKHEGTSDRLAGDLHKSLEAFADAFAQRSTALVATIAESARALQAELAAGDEARRVAQTRALESMAASLQREWQEVGARTLAQQERICETLGETARDIAASVEAQAGSTIAEVSRLMQTAAEAPRAAAEVIGQLRQELSASIARDNELLAERSRIMETLNTLLDVINRASIEQRGAIDALVVSSSGMLERAGSRFTENIDAESARMAEAAGQVTGGAVEVASLSEAFGFAVQLFTESNDKLMTTLQRIEGALDKSLTRSDEQLAYYVAQAREIIDLSIMSQRQIVDDLQALSGRLAPVVGEV
ncbi:DUF802 domain-containing protein [Aromatoleum toluvorans]|uniref:DUF802 domain-containing protein n=1 Tax=Aromatoleum toluvorans TaxID=92002 RepID=A0ABX1PXP7_9RHOO|nr:DUF802 domain-containing protein [Aromatoleum toluvorans]NMG43975.1 DUF802 domain-containing protein [Aromatoleum toluvorans]